MTRPLNRKPLTSRFATMAIGATFTKTFATQKKGTTFRNNVTMMGRRYGRKFQCLTDGLTVTVMRIG